MGKRVSLIVCMPFGAVKYTVSSMTHDYLRVCCHVRIRDNERTRGGVIDIERDKRRQNYTRMDLEKLQGAIRILTCGMSFTQPQHEECWSASTIVTYKSTILCYKIWHIININNVYQEVQKRPILWALSLE
jgi:hypothetical protein